MPFFVYILRCVDYSYYVGHTDDLERRIAEHDAGEIPGYTRGRRPLRLVSAQEFQSRADALAAERQLKGWSKAKKEALILQNWARLQQLSKRRTRGQVRAAARSPSTRPFDRLRAGSGRTGDAA